MLFNSYIYLLVFLPLSLVGFHWLQNRERHEGSLLWLNICSFIFYGWWNPAYLPLLLISIACNFQIGKQLTQHKSNRTGKRWLVCGIILNLAALAYFKYTSFALVNLNAILGTSYQDPGIILPLAISFFTFNQIAYLVDAYEGAAKEYSLNHYSLFVSFFPHLLAGPIVHHKELIPQFFNKNPREIQLTQSGIGITLISFGLFKKLIMADTLASYSNQTFKLATDGESLTFVDAWIGALSFNLQVYFDFSGYCDIACGSALLFGITLPQNFLSPFKQANIIDYWKHWHITLSRFITSYIYTPLMRNTPGGVLFGKAMIITVISMTISGLWHGANWTYVAWGGIHGALLVLNHGWRKTKIQKNFCKKTGYRSMSVLMTYILVTLTMVFFRAENINIALAYLGSMFNLESAQWLHHIQQPVISDLGRQLSIDISPMLKILPVIAIAHIWIWLLPNLQQVMNDKNALTHIRQQPTALRWKPSFLWAMITALALTASIMSLDKTGEFVYFQF